MAITVQYGPMGLAMNLATQAGVGQGQRAQQQADMAALGVQNQMQQTANQKRAQDMQNALAQQQFAADQNNKAQAIARQQVVDQQSQNQQHLDNAYRATETSFKDQLAARDQGMQEQTFADSEQQRQQRTAALARLNSGKATDADYLLFGKTPPARGMASPEATETRNELSLMMRQLDDANKDLQNHSATAKDIPDARIPAAKDGQGWEYQAAQGKVKTIQDRVNTLTGLLSQYTPKGPGAAPGASPAIAGPPAQQVGVTPEISTQLVTQAAAAAGVKPSDVDAMAAPSQSICVQVKQIVQAKFSDPTQQRAEYYRMLIGMHIDPRKLPNRPF